MIYLTEDKYGYLTAQERYSKQNMKENMDILLRFVRIKQLEGKSENTVDNYVSSLIYLAKMRGQRYVEMTTNDLREYLVEYQELNECSNNTIDHIRIILNTFFSYLHEEEYISKNPMKRIHPIKKEKVILFPFTEEDLVKLSDLKLPIRERALIDLLYSSGIRVSELMNLRISDIDFMNREGTVIGKGNKMRIIYFDVRTKLHLQTYLSERDDDCPYLFVTNTYPYQQLSRFTIEKICTKIGRMANVDHVHPHRFRRTLATTLLRKGMPIEQVQKVLGHSNIQTTLIYAMVNQDDVKINHSKFI